MIFSNILLHSEEIYANVVNIFMSLDIRAIHLEIPGQFKDDCTGKTATENIISQINTKKIIVLI